MAMPLSYQTVLPDDYGSNAPFQSLCAVLQELGFWGVELNMRDPAVIDPAALCAHLKGHGLRLSMLATGVTAKHMGLSLSHPDGETRGRSAEKCREMIDWAARASEAAATWDPSARVGLIIGFLKGGVAPDPLPARARFRRSLEEIIPHAERKSVPVLVEATNRYESSVANSLVDTAALLRGFPPAWAQMLPDTFHMNIEEADMEEALRGANGLFTSLHLSENNRFLPGFGAIDFEELFGFLEGIGYKGRLAMEGNIRGTVEADLRAAVARVGPLIEI
jgi:D-psicose/D-tagatose/L-ribulose 3-epimerase